MLLDKNSSSRDDELFEGRFCTNLIVETFLIQEMLAKDLGSRYGA